VILIVKFSPDSPKFCFYNDKKGTTVIKKIISGGQTGADQAALDAAIKLGIPHGGWIPKGRLTENGSLPKKYDLTEMPVTSYALRTEQNVIDSNGTLIISHGKLTEGSDYTRKMALKHQRPWLHINLNKTPAFKAANLIRSWITENTVEILNVAGPRESKDNLIYQDVSKLIETIYYLELIKTRPPESEQLQSKDRRPPQTVQEAIVRLISELPLKDKTTIANMDEAELIRLNSYLGKHILERFGLWSGNEKLVESCLAIADSPLQNEDDAVKVIIKKLWQELKETHRLRVIK
jgi:hypothetical protein